MSRAVIAACLQGAIAQGNATHEAERYQGIVGGFSRKLLLPYEDIGGVISPEGGFKANSIAQ
jgi:hypothetical protein